MLPTKAVRLKIGELLAADATTLAPAVDANTVCLIADAFNADEELVAADLTLATFTGSAPLEAGVGTQQAGIDPATGQQRVTILEPVGGFRWECTAAPATPETIYGIALMNDDQTVLLGVEVFDDPVTISIVGHEINAGSVQMVFADQPVS